MFILFQFIPLVVILSIAYVLLKEITFWEVLLGIILTGVITFAGYKIGSFIAVQDTEFFSNSIEKIVYYEYWESWVDQTCIRTYDCNCSTDKNGNRRCSTCTEPYDCSYCDKNHPYYSITLNTGKTKIISDSYGREITRKWKNSEQFVDLNRKIYHSGYCGKDGDAYAYYWDKEEKTAFTFCSEHRYENKIQASENIYRDYREVDKSRVVDYPKVLKNGKQKHLIGYNDANIEQFLQYVNGVYGKDKQLKFFVYVWNDTVPRSVVENQKAHWLRCNKNEFILCLFVNKGIVKDIDFITWSEENYNQILTYDDIPIEETVKKTWEYLKNNWVRLEFAKFDFITIRPSNTTFIITLIVNIVIISIAMFFFYTNIHEKNTSI